MENNNNDSTSSKRENYDPSEVELMQQDYEKYLYLVNHVKELKRKREEVEEEYFRKCGMLTQMPRFFRDDYRGLVKYRHHHFTAIGDSFTHEEKMDIMDYIAEADHIDCLLEILYYCT